MFSLWKCRQSGIVSGFNFAKICFCGRQTGKEKVSYGAWLMLHKSARNTPWKFLPRSAEVFIWSQEYQNCGQYCAIFRKEKMGWIFPWQPPQIFSKSSINFDNAEKIQGLLFAAKVNLKWPLKDFQLSHTKAAEDQWDSLKLFCFCGLVWGESYTLKNGGGDL